MPPKLTKNFLVLGIAVALLPACSVGTKAQSAPPHPLPEVVTLDGILNADTDSTPVFTPDGRTVFFDRSIGANKSIYFSRLVSGHWSAPQIAPFSGQFFDQDPAISHDGSFLVFASDRPVPGTNDSLVQSFFGKPGPGSNLWKIMLTGITWGQPTWLGAEVNASPFTDFPDLASDNSLYFIRPEHGMHTFRSQYKDGHYLPPVQVVLGDPTVTTHDPAVAPGEQFIVFDYGKTKVGLGRLCIARKQGDHWSAPQDMGDAVNSDAPWGARLAPDGTTLYFTGTTHIWRLSLASWLEPAK